jgi:hypothetical protein
MTCADCVYFGLNPRDAGVFICRRYPPRSQGIALPAPGGVHIQILALWPSVNREDHCGELEVAPKVISKNH